MRSTSIIGTAANVNDGTQGHRLSHGEEEVVFADARVSGPIQIKLHGENARDHANDRHRITFD